VSFWRRLLGLRARGRRRRPPPPARTIVSTATDRDASDFIAECFDLPFEEEEDDRLFANFKELPRIDALRGRGRRREALMLCRQGIRRHPDSFLFYQRAADIYDDLGKPARAERMLRKGLERSRSRCSLCCRLGDRALQRKEYRTAVLWWIRGAALQVVAGRYVDMEPFLNLAYVCRAMEMHDEEKWLLELADRASCQGPVRYDEAGVELRFRAARRLRSARDDAIPRAIRLLRERYRGRSEGGR
jgi:tetratricopeptide (TPR) repeat protein